MHADARKLLWDAQQAAERIARFGSWKSFFDYEQTNTCVQQLSGSSKSSARP